MKPLLILAGVAVLACGAVATAEAKVFDFSYSGVGENGSGTFTTGDAGSPYAITGITGVANGATITGLSPYASADNLLFTPGPSYADFGGISFSTATLGDFNLTDFTGPMSILSSVTDPGGFGGAATEISMTVSAVPEPTIWAMMLVGFGVIGAAMRTRRKTIGAIAGAS